MSEPILPPRKPMSEESNEEEPSGEIRDIHLYPEEREVLTTECEPVEVGDDTESLVDDLIRTMNHFNGAGLSAPQIGVQKRVAVADPMDPTADPFVLINPEILDKTDEMTNTEGCLSLPGMSGEVTRPRKIRYETTTLGGERMEFVEEDYNSMVIQHEIDHLDGVLFFEHFSPVERRMQMKEYKKLRKAASREDGFDLLEVRT